MHVLKKLTKYSLYLIASIFLYALLSVLLSYITVNKNSVNPSDSETIYIHTNGVHLSVILPVKSMTTKLKEDLVLPKKHNYAKFGWGDKNFYLNVPEWSNFKIQYALGALFLDNPTAIHVSTFKRRRKNWIPVKINKEELGKMNTYIQNSFDISTNGKKITIPQSLYTDHDTFYEAQGTYSPAKTCNTWVNNGFKESGLKASFWTLFDFGLLNKYQND